MDHVVYVDAQAQELAHLLDGTKTMIIRGATGRKLPYGRVNSGDRLFFIQNNGEGTVRACGVVKQVINSDPLSKDDSIALVQRHQDRLKLTEKQFSRWAGKRYLVLIEVEQVAAVDPLPVDRSGYGNMDDWLPVGDIEAVRLSEQSKVDS